MGSGWDRSRAVLGIETASGRPPTTGCRRKPPTRKGLYAKGWEPVKGVLVGYIRMAEYKGGGALVDIVPLRVFSVPFFFAGLHNPQKKQHFRGGVCSGGNAHSRASGASASRPGFPATIHP